MAPLNPQQKATGMKMNPIRVFVVAHPSIVRLGLAAMLTFDGGFALAGDAASGADALRGVAESRAGERPDLWLIDPLLPDMSVADLVLSASASNPELGFAVLSDDSRDGVLPQGLTAIERLVRLPRSVTPAALLKALHGLRGGPVRPGAAITGGIADPGDRSNRSRNDSIGPHGIVGAPGAAAQWLRNPLTHREQELLTLMGLGLPNQQIADRLDIAMPTVKFHITHILKKLGADNRTEAVLLGLRHGLVAMP